MMRVNSFATYKQCCSDAVHQRLLQPIQPLARIITVYCHVCSEEFVLLQTCKIIALDAYTGFICPNLCIVLPIHYNEGTKVHNPRRHCPACVLYSNCS